MRLHADLSLPAEVAAPALDSVPWLPSPAPGVERYLLERDGEEVARCTTVVRYRPGASFPRHIHSGGEEYFVLQGTFHDEHGAFPEGSYVRNPIGSGHAPFTGDDGATIWVKLRQMHASDTAQVHMQSSLPPPSSASGCSRQALYANATTGEEVALEAWPPGAELTVGSASGGDELFVVRGRLEHADGKGQLAEWSWLRCPPAPAGRDGAGRQLRASAEGCTLLRKCNHLRWQLPGAGG